MNSEDFKTFLIDLRDVMGKDPFTLLLDNASIHKTKAVQEYAKKARITIAYNVPYSPWFNGIEDYWGLVKSRFRKEMGELHLG